MRTVLQRVAIRLASVFIAAAFLAYSAWIVSMIQSTTSWTAVAMAALLLAAPVLFARSLGLRVARAGEAVTPKLTEASTIPPLIGVELRIPDYQCAAFAQEVAALVAAGARVVAIDVAELQSASLVKPDGGTGGGAVMLTIIRKDELATDVTAPSMPGNGLPARARSTDRRLTSR
jgi:hypothetical protein